MVESIGKDFNFYQRTAAVAGTFPLAAGTDPHVQIAFRGARRIMLVGIAGSDVQYSFNGNTLHGRISAGQIFNFETRNEDKMWILGTGTVDVHAWHIGV